MPNFSNAKIGDKVYSLLHGEAFIVSIDKTTYTRPYLNAQIPTGYTFSFYEDGRAHSLDPCVFWSKPEISDPPPPKRKIVKSVEKWVLISQDGTINYTFNTEDSANYALRNSTKTFHIVKLTGTYETEE
jgi:hypothetical protein